MSAAHVYFAAEDAEPLAPLGKCARCGVTEDPTIAIFWPTTEDGGQHCPECAGEMPSEGYAHWICYARRDRRGEMAKLLGPYSAAEAERNLTYFRGLENVESAWVLHMPEWT
jgi:hypothetical protein